jgi:alkylation response protein AidB-like acyl-CoA dehydrogenase
MAFFQNPPLLGDAFATDRLLRQYVARLLSTAGDEGNDVRAHVESDLAEMGALVPGLYAKRVADYAAVPQLVQWSPWGERIDDIALTPLWQEARRVAAERGVVGTAYERRSGRFSRVHQFALAYLFDQGTAVYTCPLAMTDGAARTLIASGNQKLVERAVPRLTARDPSRAWTSGQWMTERTGGSDVAISETIARPDASGAGFRLYGTKWFTSATTSEMALALARPEGNPPGGKGLALFYVETRGEGGRLEGIAINRLKDKLGTRQVPTAELTLDGARGEPVAGLSEGIKNITPMLLVTRTWNSVAAVSIMRRGLALARDYAKKRVAFGAPLVDKPLHADTLAIAHAEYEAAFLLTFRLVELLGKDETRVIGEDESQLLRLLSPVVKLTTGKQAVAVTSELLESFGGAGYIEDTGLPDLLRDAQVLPIWEGTTNVLSLDLLRALSRAPSLAAVHGEIARATRGAEQAGLAEEARLATHAAKHAESWLGRTKDAGPDAIEAGARRFGLTLGRSLELALAIEHAVWSQREGDPRPAAAARVFARTRIDHVLDEDFAAAASLLVRYDE